MSTLADVIELRVPSKAEYVSIVRALAKDIARRLGLPAFAVDDVQIAVSEACANVVRHAYSRDQQGSEIIIRFAVRGSRLIMEVADSGRGFSKTVIQPRYSADKDGGFGLMLIRSLMDSISLDTSPDQGTVVRMVKKTDRVRPQRSMSPSRSAARNSS